MAELLKETEAEPTEYPGFKRHIWHRIEKYIRFRYHDRQVIWIVEGQGEWVPPLSPVTSTTTECWDGSAWVSVTLDPSPLGGYQLDQEGPYRFTCQVGNGDAPEPVTEAATRLAAYMGEEHDNPGVSSYSVSIDGALSESYDRSTSWMARAFQHSGAADLLRQYRRVK